MRDGRTRERRVPQDGSEKKRYFFSDLRFLRLQNIDRPGTRAAAPEGWCVYCLPGRQVDSKTGRPGGSLHGLVRGAYAL